MQEYLIYDGEKAVGSARVEREGMTLCIRCTCCQAVKGEAICAQWEGGRFLLGKCFPEKDNLVLFRRIPKRAIPSKEISFAICREDRELLDPSVPIGDLSRLKSANLVVENGVYYLNYSNSNPTGQ